MSIDLSDELKSEVIRHLSADSRVTSLVPQDSIFAMTVPAGVPWPFIRYGIPVVTPYEASCWSGCSVRVTLHAFSEGTKTLAGESAASRIAKNIAASMKEFGTEDIALISCDWVATRLLSEDAEADRWHAIVEFDVIVVQKD